MLKIIFDYLDRMGQDCYLETYKEGNIKKYEHYVFELLEASKIFKTVVIQYSKKNILRKAKENEDE